MDRQIQAWMNTESEIETEIDRETSKDRLLYSQTERKERQRERLT